MKAMILVLAVVWVGCGAPPLSPEKSAIIFEKAVRKQLGKPTGELTKADLEKVTRLFLGYTQITDAGLKELTKLKHLKLLGLGHTQITDAGLKEVAKLKQLEALGLGFTKITDVGLKELAKLKQLKSLDLGFTEVTETGKAALQKALPSCKIGNNAKFKFP